MGKILPILLALVGLGAGVGAGLMLKPEPQVVEINPCGDTDGGDHPAVEVEEEEHAEEGAPTSDFVKMNNQFVVPVVSDAEVSALVVLAFSLEVKPGGSEEFYQREPKLRDAFLQILFAHANAGGFDGVFTGAEKLNSMRAALREAAQRILGDIVIDVLITDFVRQDI